MRLLLISFLLLLIFNTTNAQITKGNWLVGGNGLISYSHETLLGDPVNSLDIALSPNIGYFFSDKLAGGLKINFGYKKLTYKGPTSETSSIGYSPFLRYYFLPTNNIANIFGETSFSHRFSLNTKDDDNTYSISAGPVIYFNPSVGIEFTLNYQRFIHPNSAEIKQDIFIFGIGLQIHLQKEKL